MGHFLSSQTIHFKVVLCAPLDFLLLCVRREEIVFVCLLLLLLSFVHKVCLISYLCMCVIHVMLV